MNAATIKQRVTMLTFAALFAVTALCTATVPVSAAASSTKKTCVQKLWGNGNADACVKDIQIMVNQSGWGSKTKVKEDANFGPKTEAAVLAYQKHYKNIYYDGIVGPQTWGKLCNDSRVLKKNSKGAKAAKHAGCDALKKTTSSHVTQCYTLDRLKCIR